MKEKDFDTLLEAVQEMKAHRAGKKTGARLHVPKTINVRKIRSELGMTQREFCVTFAIAERTLKSWESGARTPEGPARILLRMIGKDANAVLQLAH